MKLLISQGRFPKVMLYIFYRKIMKNHQNLHLLSFPEILSDSQLNGVIAMIRLVGLKFSVPVFSALKTMKRGKKSDKIIEPEN